MKEYKFVFYILKLIVNFTLFKNYKFFFEVANYICDLYILININIFHINFLKKKRRKKLEFI